MTKEQEKFDKFFEKYGWGHKSFFNRPHWTRRRFFQICGAGVTASYLTQRYAKAQIAGDHQFRYGHQEYGAERDLHSAGRRAQPHGYLRSEGSPGHHARQFQPGNGERRHVAHRPAAESGQHARRFRHCPLHAGACAGAFAGADLDADRTQPSRGAGQHRAQYRQRGGDRKGSAAPARTGFPDVPGAQFRRRRGAGILPGGLRSIQGGPDHRGHLLHHQSGRPDQLQQPLEPGAFARWRAAHRLALRPADGRLRGFLPIRAADDVQPGGEQGVRVLLGG